MYLPAFPEIAAASNTSGRPFSLTASSYWPGFRQVNCFMGQPLDSVWTQAAALCRADVVHRGIVALPVRARDVNWLVAMRFLQALGGCAAQTAASGDGARFLPSLGNRQNHFVADFDPGSVTFAGANGGRRGGDTPGLAMGFHHPGRNGMVERLIVYHQYLPVGYKPDRSVSLRLTPIVCTPARCCGSWQRSSRSRSYGAFAFSGICWYMWRVRPSVFMEVFHVNARTFSLIFIGLATGFIGSNVRSTSCRCAGFPAPKFIWVCC